MEAGALAPAEGSVSFSAGARAFDGEAGRSLFAARRGDRCAVLSVYVSIIGKFASAASSGLDGKDIDGPLDENA
jgi:hypothetical protein